MQPRLDPRFYGLNGEWEVENQGSLPIMTWTSIPQPCARAMIPSWKKAVEVVLRLVKDHPQPQ